MSLIIGHPSERARGYYYGVVLPAIANHMHDEDWRRVHEIVLRDLSLEAVHDWLKGRLLPGGDDPDLPGFARRTANGYISVKDYNDFIFRASIWARMRGIHIPEPEEPL